MSTAEIEKRSVALIHKDIGARVEFDASANTLCDRRMGPITRDERCETCEMDITSCPGHFGHIRLNHPIIPDMFITRIRNAIKSLCTECLKPLVSKKKCSHCSAERPKIITHPTDNYFEIIFKNKEPVIYTGKDIIEKYPFLAKYVFECIVVIPMCNRPYVQFTKTEWRADELTRLYSKIIQANTALVTTEDTPSIFHLSKISLLNREVRTIYDSETKKKIIPKNNPRGFKQRLGKKDGLFRRNILGSRVNFTGRSVITCDPDLSVLDIGIPQCFASTLTMPETCTGFNLKQMQKMVSNGQIKHCVISNIPYVVKHDTVLKIGDIVHRPLQNGDPVLVNRQPSLHLGSMMVHAVRILPGLTIRLPMATCKSYNADFDGDEMNVYVPQSYAARAEAMEVMSVSQNIINRKNGAPLINIIYDGILGIYEMSKDTSIVPTALYNDICTYIDYWPTSHCAQSAMETLSIALPPKFNLFTDSVAIVNGIIKKGPITASITKQIICKLHQEYSKETVIQFIDRAQFITNKWMQNKGYSFCFMDAARAPIPFQDAFPPNVHTEQQKLTYLNRVRDAITHPSNEYGDNGFLTMVAAGSKGTLFNYTQCSAMLGQQAIDGVRIKKQFNNATRLLPHFPPNQEDTPTNGGFITGNLFTGLKPTEMYIHIMSGMKGVIDTGKGTAQTGYLARQLVKTLENVVVSDSNQVVLNEKVIQFHSTASPGTRIGSIAAMSISETSTQMILNSFHFAGDSNMTTQGFPRVRELARLTDSKPVISAVVTSPIVLKQYLVGDLIDHAFILPSEKTALWEVIYVATVYPNKPFVPFSGFCIELHFHSRFLESIKAIHSAFPAFTITSTHPKYEFITRIHIPDPSFKKTCVALKKIKKTIVSGIDGVRDQYISAKNTVNLLISRNKAGNVLKALFNHPHVVKSSITTNSPSIANEWFGIEAARMTLHREFKQIMDMYDSHYAILCDTMCQSECIQSILKTGVLQNIKDSIFNQACYEETFDVLINGAADAKTDKCGDVSTRIMIGTPIRNEIVQTDYSPEYQDYSPTNNTYSPSKETYSPSKEHKNIQHLINKLFE